MTAAAAGLGLAAAEAPTRRERYSPHQRRSSQPPLRLPLACRVAKDTAGGSRLRNLPNLRVPPPQRHRPRIRTEPKRPFPAPRPCHRQRPCPFSSCRGRHRSASGTIGTRAAHQSVVGLSFIRPTSHWRSRERCSRRAVLLAEAGTACRKLLLAPIVLRVIGLRPGHLLSRSLTTVHLRHLSSAPASGHEGNPLSMVRKPPLWLRNTCPVQCSNDLAGAAVGLSFLHPHLKYVWGRLR